jgi:hypothetical protein
MSNARYSILIFAAVMIGLRRESMLWTGASWADIPEPAARIR